MEVAVKLVRNLAKLVLVGAVGLTLAACVYEPAYAPAPGYGYAPAYYGAPVAVGYGGYYHYGYGWGGRWR
jgi:hypothetical protein